MLAQKDTFGNEYVIRYMSRLLKGSELNYPITEKECLAAVWCIKECRIYIWGTKFTLVTDHSALVYLLNIKDYHGRLGRWAVYMQSYEWEFETPKDLEEITTEVEFNEEQSKRFNREVMSRVGKLIAKGVNDLGVCTVREHNIDTMDATPIYIPPYRKSRAEREILQNMIKEMLTAGIIEESNSAWSAPVVLIPKKDGTWRLCIDYRKLNTVTKTEYWPMPNMQEIFDEFSGSSFSLQ